MLNVKLIFASCSILNICRIAMIFFSTLWQRLDQARHLSCSLHSQHSSLLLVFAVWVYLLCCFCGDQQMCWSRLLNCPLQHLFQRWKALLMKAPYKGNSDCHTPQIGNGPCGIQLGFARRSIAGFNAMEDRLRYCNYQGDQLTHSS